MGFVKNTTYYEGVVYEWNLPTGWTCPSALECLVTVDKKTGKFNNRSKEFRCYAASPERFPAVREHRWNNFELSKRGDISEPPKKCENVRVHGAGDFFNQKYFDLWMEYAEYNNDINFWAYTKSLNYWIKRIGSIPANFILTASYGGKFDHLIKENKLKYAKVIKSEEEAEGMPIDTNDHYARIEGVSFCLLDNSKFNKKTKKERGKDE